MFSFLHLLRGVELFDPSPRTLADFLFCFFFQFL